MNELVLDVYILMLHWSKKKEAAVVRATRGRWGPFLMEPSLFFIDLIIAGGPRSKHNGRLHVFSRIPFVNPFMIQTARVIIAYNLVEKEEVCVHGIECDKKRGMMKKTNESRSQVFHFTPPQQNK